MPVSSLFFTMSLCLLLCHSFICYSFFLTLTIRACTNKYRAHTHTCGKAKKVIRTLTILSEVPPLEMVVPLSPTREGRVWDIQLVTMAMVLSTAPIFSMGTLMFASCGAPAQTALQPALPYPALDLRLQSTPLCSRQSRQETSQSASASAWAAAEPPERTRHSYQTGSVKGTTRDRLEESSSHPTASRWNLPSQSDCLSLTPSLSLTLFPSLSLPHSPLVSPFLSPSLSLTLSSSRCRAAHWLPLFLIPSQSASAPSLPTLFCMQVSILFLSSLSLTFGCSFMTHILACVLAHTHFWGVEIRERPVSVGWSVLCYVTCVRPGLPRHSRLSCSLTRLSVLDGGLMISRGGWMDIMLAKGSGGETWAGGFARF